MLIYTKIKNPRTTYITELIFKDLLGFSTIEFCKELGYFEQHPTIYKFSYGEYVHQSIPFLAQGSLLLEQNGLESQPPRFLGAGKSAYCFPVEDQRSILHFDFFALAFYLLSRYEEYLDFEGGQHGRFAAHHSAAHRAGFLQYPLVDCWLIQLRLQLQKYYPELPQGPRYSFQPSYDIDYAWAYKHKAAWRQWAASLRDLLKGQMASFYKRRAVLIGRQADPFDTFDLLDRLHRQYAHLQPIYFMLLGKYGSYDKNVRPDHPAMQALVQRLGEQYPLGIHPSYGSNKNTSQLKREIELLRQQIGQVTKSRQHFVMLRFPQTYRQLIELGIEEDYSMGYASQPGFRASIAQPFYWFDLQANQKTSLKVHPFMLMDVTFKNYMELSPQAAIEQMQPIIERCKEVGGALMSIWHNNSLCECEGWEGWRTVYEQLLKAV